MMTETIGLMPLIPLALLAVAVLAAIRLLRSGRPWWPALGSFAAVISLGTVALVVIALGAMVFIGRRGSVPVEEVSYSRTVAVNVNRSASSHHATDGGWVASDEYEFAADVYPSPESAAVALTRQLAESVDHVADTGEGLVTLYVNGDIEGPGLIRVMDAFRKRVRVLNPPRTDVEPAALSRGEACLTIRSSVDGTDGAGGQERIGQVTATLAGADQHISRSARYVDKLWVEDLTAFESREGELSHRYFVARSGGLSPTREEATERAFQAAATRLEAQIGPEFMRGRWTVVEPNWVREEMESALRGPKALVYGSQPLMADWFVQRFDRPYGQVWQAAVLVDASGKNVNALADHVRARQAAKMGSWRRTGLSMAGLVALILVVYAFLNAATRGYYVWAMRVAAVLLVIGGVLFVLAFA